MKKIKNIGIQGFRRLRDVEIKMRPFMVMIGANGVGKTSLLDALYLLAASASGKLNQTLVDFGGVADVCTRGWPNGIRFSAGMENLNHAPLLYQLHLETMGQTYMIVNEQLTQQEAGYEKPFKHIETIRGDVRYYSPEVRRIVQPDWDFDVKESALAQVPKMYKQADDFRRILGSATQYHVLDVSKRAPIKLPQQMRPVVLPGTNGEDLVPFLYNLRETDRDSYDLIESTLRVAFPGFDSMSFPPVAAGMLSLTWREKYGREPIYIHQLSEGTLRFLWLVSLLRSSGLSTITMIDEPEVSLHPELLMLLVDLLREACEKTQVIVATHSDRFVRFLEPHEVLILDLDEEGHTVATWGDSLDLERWLADYSLDEVWRMGCMGGRS